MKRVLIPLAPGFEEIEALTAVDILRRAGAEVILAGTIDGPIEGRNRIRVAADITLDKAGADYDMIVLPGGAEGTENLRKDRRIKKIVQDLHARKMFVAAICAAPSVLSDIGITGDSVITSHPSVRRRLKARRISEERVVVDGNIITSQGPGTAMEFAFSLVEALYGPEKATEVNKGVLARI